MIWKFAFWRLQSHPHKLTALGNLWIFNQWFQSPSDLNSFLLSFPWISGFLFNRWEISLWFQFFMIPWSKVVNIFCFVLQALCCFLLFSKILLTFKVKSCFLFISLYLSLSLSICVPQMKSSRKSKPKVIPTITSQLAQFNCS